MIGLITEYVDSHIMAMFLYVICNQKSLVMHAGIDDWLDSIRLEPVRNNTFS